MGMSSLGKGNPRIVWTMRPRTYRGASKPIRPCWGAQAPMGKLIWKSGSLAGCCGAR